VDDDVPQITPAHLRRADEMCRRRLAREVHGRKRRANPGSSARFAVSNRVEADARLAQSESGTPRAEAFVDPRELEPEQRALYRAARRGYLDIFGDTPARVVELDFRTPLPELGVDLASSLGVAAELDGGERELRKVLVGSAREGAPLIDDVDLRVALVRTASWAPEHLRVVAADVIQLRVQTFEPDLAPAREAAIEWIDERVPRVLELAADARPRAGRDCQGCAFVAGCSAHSV